LKRLRHSLLSIKAGCNNGNMFSYSALDQGGQSLAEVLVITLALLPLLVFGIWIGKVGDIQLSTGAAARKLAFDCVQRRDDCQDLQASPDPVDVIRKNFFSHFDREVMSLDGLDDQATNLTANPLWRDRQGSPLIANFSDVSAQTKVQSLNAPGSHMQNSNQKWVADAAEHLSNFAGPGHFGLQLYGGFISARVQVKISQDAPSYENGGRLDVFPLTMQRHVALLGDEWNSTGTDSGRTDSTLYRVNQGKQLPIAGSVGDAALSLAYSGTRAGMSFMNNVMSLESSASRFRWNQVDVGIIPPDRKVGGLPAGANPSPSLPEYGPGEGP
jgi:hypothetical protein